MTCLECAEVAHPVALVTGVCPRCWYRRYEREWSHQTLDRSPERPAGWLLEALENSESEPDTLMKGKPKPRRPK
jgi:hypothetical protein